MMWNKNRITRGKKSEKGQGFLELGLSLVFLLMLLAVVIDLGWAFFTLIALRDAAQEAASVAAICPPTRPPDPSYSANETRIRSRLSSAATSPIDTSGIEAGNIVIRVLDPADGTEITDGSFGVGDSVEVRITYMHNIMVPMIGAFIGKQSYPLEVNSVDTILATDCRIGP